MSDDALRKHMVLQQANQHNHKQTEQGQQDNKNPAALNVVDELFTRLKAITSVGSAFKTASEEAIVKQEWMLAFREEGVTKQSMIDEGIENVRIKARKSRSTTWFPSVGEFIDLCLGNNNKLDYAQRALDLFNSAQKQIDSVGQMVVSKHAFDLKQMRAADTNKQFIELYLSYAANNEVTALEAFALTETVQLSPEQLKDANNRKLNAQNECLNQLHGLFGKPKPKEAVVEPTKQAGVQQGSLKTYAKTPAQLEAEKQRQLDMIKGLK